MGNPFHNISKHWHRDDPLEEEGFQAFSPLQTYNHYQSKLSLCTIHTAWNWNHCQVAISLFNQMLFKHTFKKNKHKLQFKTLFSTYNYISKWNCIFNKKKCIWNLISFIVKSGCYKWSQDGGEGWKSKRDLWHQPKKKKKKIIKTNSFFNLEYWAPMMHAQWNEDMHKESKPGQFTFTLVHVHFNTINTY